MAPPNCEQQHHCQKHNVSIRVVAAACLAYALACLPWQCAHFSTQSPQTWIRSRDKLQAPQTRTPTQAARLTKRYPVTCAVSCPTHGQPSRSPKKIQSEQDMTPCAQNKIKTNVLPNGDHINSTLCTLGHIGRLRALGSTVSCVPGPERPKRWRSLRQTTPLCIPKGANESVSSTHHGRKEHI